jgi:GH24 family phage-related lysozyme (muramidase)
MQDMRLSWMSITLLSALAACADLPQREAATPAPLPTAAQSLALKSAATPSVDTAQPAAASSRGEVAAPARPGLAVAAVALNHDAPAAPAPGSGERRPATMWATSEAALQIIKAAESPDGPHLKAYAEGKRWFIGYGHAGAARGQVISPERAEELLKQDVRKCERAIGQAVKVDVNRNEFSAMVALCHNIGIPRFKHSGVVAKLNKGLRDEAAQAFNDWARPASLAVRRQMEIALFLR